MTEAMRQANKAAIVEYFQSGCKAHVRSFGIELEHTLVHEDGSPVSYSGEHGVQWILERLSSHWDRQDRTSAGQLLGLARPGATITLEPAAQLELSAGPFSSLADAAQAFEAFRAELDAVCAPAGIVVETLGYHPTAKAASLELIPKRRYAIMNDYLGAIGPYGIYMMRGSAATQVSIDYRTEADAIAKLRLAHRLTPILSCMTDNAPDFEGAPSPHHCMRTEIWRRCDPDRCGLIPGILDKSFSFERYAEYLLATPAVIAIDADGTLRPTHKTFAELYADRLMDVAAIEQMLSMFFNDARLKTYVEIRPADAMPREFVIAYTALIKGLFYNDDSLEAAAESLGAVDEDAWRAAQDAIMADGFGARVYGRPIRELCLELLAIAADGLDEWERESLAPFEVLATKGLSLAETVFD